MTQPEISALLAGAVDQLDLPAEVVADAERIYADIGDFLREELPAGRDWAFYPQGSARLGTAVRPAGSAEWDIDAVAEVDVDRTAIGHDELIALIGATLAGYLDARSTGRAVVTELEAGRRCWTLRFAHPFHVDVLPAVSHRLDTSTAIWITDRSAATWQVCDPLGYASWFEDRMGDELAAQRRALARATNVWVEAIPTWRAKTTLQRTVQVLKLHRNGYFAGDPMCRPPSCVVTTLAAHAYQREPDLCDALVGAADRMPRFLDTSGEVIVLENPVQPDDNLADRWGAVPGAFARFDPWLDDLRTVLRDANSTSRGARGAIDVLARRFDRALLEAALAAGSVPDHRGRVARRR
jgi:hypothetical protein